MTFVYSPAKVEEEEEEEERSSRTMVSPRYQCDRRSFFSRRRQKIIFIFLFLGLLIFANRELVLTRAFAAEDRDQEQI